MSTVSCSVRCQRACTGASLSRPLPELTPVRSPPGGADHAGAAALGRTDRHAAARTASEHHGSQGADLKVGPLSSEVIPSRPGVSDVRTGFRKWLVRWEWRKSRRECVGRFVITLASEAATDVV